MKYQISTTGRITIAFLLLTVIYFPVFSSDIKVVLTGNTMDLEAGQLIKAIDQHCAQSSDTVFWILNGDIFPQSFSDEQVAQWKTDANHLLTKYPNLHILLNQGDRDWDDSGPQGWERIQRLEKILDRVKHPRFHIFFHRGCPGPWVFKASSILNILILNSQWWTHPYEKPIPSMNVCDISTEDVFLEEFRDQLDEIENKNMLVLSHYPLESLGNYGGRFSIGSYLFPPFIGNAISSYHQNIGGEKDIVNENFDDFRKSLGEILLDHSSIIFASGHEKNHSIFHVEENYYINSGALGDVKYVAKNNNAPFVSRQTGFLEIQYKSFGDVQYQFFEFDENSIKPSQNGVLLVSSCGDSGKEFKNTAFVPCLSNELNQEKMTGNWSEKKMVVAGEEYALNGFAKFMFGNHYRKSWTIPVEVPYLNLDTTYGGLIINKKGGGRQTTSLKMSAENGKKYVFRSVNKNPSKALSYDLRGTIISKVIKDQTTTQQPYGAMAASYLLDKIDILHARPTLYLLPDDDKLGVFKSDYGNLLGMLEDRPSGKVNKDIIFGKADDIVKSFEMFEELYDDHDSGVDLDEFSRARVFDMLVGDWGKHEDNWKWASYKIKGGRRFRPIPRDRDHVFSRWDGLLPYLADREWAKPSGENFDYKIKGLRSLMWQARHLDRLLGNQLEMDDWIKSAEEIQSSITDKDIEEAIKKMPPEIYHPDGKEIEDKLKARIKDLHLYAKRYYLMLAKEVDVLGSNKAEYFNAERNDNGSVTVKVFDLKKKSGLPDPQRKFYERTFYPEQTKEIRLYGLGNDDVFNIAGETQKSILIRAIGGSGEDKFIDNSNVHSGGKKTLIYDKDQNSRVDGKQETKRMVPKDEDNYNYERTAFKYNTYFPKLLVTYNPFIGFALQGGASFTNHNFSKPDFSAKHHFNFAITTQSNYEISYSNQLRYLIGKWDGISEINISRPLNYSYFFGIGNNTMNDEANGTDYYKTQYNSIRLTAGLTRTFWEKSEVSFKGNYEQTEGILRENSFLQDNPNVFGVEKLDLLYLLGVIDFDFRDEVILPERGFHLRIRQVAGHVSNTGEDLASLTDFSMEQYLSTYNKNPFTLGVRVGGGISNGTLPFFKLFSLGQLNDLRGFRRNRFTGESKAYLNTILRWQIVETHRTTIPLKVGLTMFYDMGRVWSKNDETAADFWHKGYGAGFYIVPFQQRFALHASVGSSKEEPILFMFGIGSVFRPSQ